MWSVYGIDSPNVEGVTSAKSFVIGNFKPSENITENDFNNAGKSFLAYDVGANTPPLIVYPSGNKFSNYVESGSFPTNLLGYNRFNILHRKSVNGNIEYEYDQCYYLWTFHESGTNLYYFDAYRLGSLSYSQCPKVDFRAYTNNAITRNYVRSLQLIATKGNGKGGIGCVRPLWGLDFTGISQFDDNPIQYVLGPIMPASTIDEWLKYLNEEDNPDAPDKPILNPEDADSHTATSANWTWLNKFKIMNLSTLPSNLLIDEEWIDDYTYLKQQQYMVYDDGNDSSFRYHLHSVYTNSAGYAQMNQTWKNINDEKIQVGHSVTTCYRLTSDSGYFSTSDSIIDNFTGGYYTTFRIGVPDYIEIGPMDIDASNFSVPQLSTLQFIVGSHSFSISQNYPNSTYDWCDNWTEGVGRSNGFGDCCIVRCNGHYYLGGFFRFGVGYANVGFCLLCRIDALDELPNQGGSNPGDPAGDGIPTRDLDNIFGTGSETEPNPSTDKEVQDNLGDPNNGGTGEFADPVNTQDETNLHDGSVDNGTGDPHEGDTEIGDPSSNVPSDISSAGTVSGTGVISVFTPTLAELSTFTAEMLSPTVLNSIKNFFTTNPMDGIFSLHMLPFTGFEGTAVAAPRIGTHNFTATMTLAATEYLTIDYGSVYVPFVYDGYENYAPNSDVKIFLPFIGTKDVDINVIQGCNCNLKYNVSLVTGDIYAYLYCQWAGASGQPGTGEGVNHLMYHWQGNCAATIPLSHLDSSNYISGSMRAAGGISSLVAGAVTGNPLAIAGGVMAAGQGLINSTAEKGRTQIITSGNISGVSAFMGCREPYFIFSRPIIAFNSSYNRYLGQYSNAVMRISELRNGTFTQMRNIDLAGIPATNDELNELESILKGGFYI